ncbi:MAG: 2-amino-4-hydroxy-6-hydroxymethyldihydropteridine diphosphokinase [Sphingobacteriales bacterium]|jgi:2-amino-4-hydroxy-6-hydroxymethyldihydropteridine diphosphokinase
MIDSKNRVFISLGSNLNDRMSNLSFGLSEIELNIGEITKRSSIYETEPWGTSAGDKFLNMVIEGYTDKKPLELLTALHEIEAKKGRIRKVVNEPRNLDLDILFYGHSKIISKKIGIPHPRVSQRKFILQPLSEVAPYFIHPILEKTINDLKANCSDKLKVTLIKA